MDMRVPVAAIGRTIRRRIALVRSSRKVSRRGGGQVIGRFDGNAVNEMRARSLATESEYRISN